MHYVYAGRLLSIRDIAGRAQKIDSHRRWKKWNERKIEKRYWFQFVAERLCRRRNMRRGFQNNMR